MGGDCVVSKDLEDKAHQRRKHQRKMERGPCGISSGGPKHKNAWDKLEGKETSQFYGGDYHC